MKIYQVSRANSPANIRNLNEQMDLHPDAHACPMRYEVTLRKLGGHPSDFCIGFVVSHLCLADWCELHGYEVIAYSHQSTRIAKAHERTDLC